MSNLSNTLEKIREEIAKCRTRVLDECEMEMGGAGRWSFLRSRLLNYFGTRGLEGNIEKILVSEVENAND